MTEPLAIDLFTGLHGWGAGLEAEVIAIVMRHSRVDPTVCRYMIARTAVIGICSTRTGEKASELFYKLADEFATMDTP